MINRLSDRYERKKYNTHFNISTMKRSLILTVAISMFCIGNLWSQTGIINNGAKIIINNSAILHVDGASGADYYNQSYDGSTHGRIILDGKFKIDGNLYNNASSGYLFMDLGTDGEIHFIGEASQVIGGSAEINIESLTLDNTSGLSLSTNTFINGSLTLTNGIFGLGSNNLGLSSTSSISGSFDETTMIVPNSTGELRKNYSSNGSFTFPVGDTVATDEYSPFQVEFTSGTYGDSAYVGINLANAKHPNNTSATDYLDRYWSLSQNNISSFSADITGTYTDNDIQGTETSIYGAHYDNPYWNELGAVNSGSNTITGTVTSFSDFTGAEQSAVTPSIAISGTAISEGAEDAQTITVTLSNDDFVTSLNSSNWTVLNLPEGVSFASLTRNGDKVATITLGGNRIKDYDTDITNLTVQVSHNELVNASSGTYTDNDGFTFSANDDDESILLADDGSIVEGAEDGEIVTVTAVGGTFADPINAGNWTVTNLPADVSAGSIDRIDETTVEITLSGNTSTGDYDSDITNMTVEFTPAEIDDRSTGNVSANSGVTFTAIDESLTVTMDDDGDIQESAEAGEIIQIRLEGGYNFVSTLTASNWTLSNLPEGVTKGAVTKIDADSATITLVGNRIKDYDANITNLTVQIAQAEIVGAPSQAVVSTGVTFTATDDAESITIGNDGITEGSEDTEIVGIKLAGGTFVSSINASDFALSNLPGGVIKGDVTRISADSVTIELSGNRTEDYDANITDLTVSIDPSQIDDHTGSNIEASTGVTFTATDDAESLAIGDDGEILESAEDGEIIGVKITGGTVVDPIIAGNWTLSNLPTGVTKGTVTRIANDSVTIVLNGNASVDYDSDVTNLTLTVTPDQIDDYTEITDLTVNTGVTFTATDEPVVVTMADDGEILEGAEDTEVITINLSEDIFDNPLDIANWTFSNLPDGVVKGSTLTRIGDTQATIDLSGDATSDYDTDITNVTLEIAGEELMQHTGSPVSANTGITMIATNDAESVVMADDGEILEGSEDGEIIGIKLTGGTFVNPVTSLNWTLSNLPTGVTKGTVTRIGSDSVTIALSNNASADYDTDITNMTVTIAAAEVDDTDADLEITTGVTFTATIESVSIAMTNLSTINEESEDGAEIDVTLSNDEFVATLTESNWILTNLPKGVELGSISRISSTEATIYLSGNRTCDYDSDITNLSLEILGDEFENQSVSASTGTGVTFTAYDDLESLALSFDGEIIEGNEDSEVITVELNGGTYTTDINSNNWTLTNQPTGVSVGSLLRINDTIVEINLSGTRTVDYDSDISNLTITVTDAEIDDHSSGDLSDNTGVTFSATNEAATIAHAGLTEENLNGANITFELTDENFADGSINKANFTLNNAPTGFSIDYITYFDETNITVYFVYDGTDFDVDVTDFSITVDPLEIDGVGSVQSNDLTITAIVEDAYITMSDDVINEGAEDTEIITITLYEDEFVPSLATVNWTLSNLPGGVSKGTLTRTSATTATIELTDDRTQDYDNNIVDLTLDITADELVSFASAVSANSGVTFIADDDEETIAFTDDGSLNEGLESGETLVVTLSGGTFVETLNDANWTLTGQPEGVTVNTITRDNTTQASIELTGDRITDYDIDITSAFLEISSDEIDDYSGSNISVSTGVTFVANVESLAISHAGLTEANIDGATIDISLTDETFADATLEMANFNLNNTPTGVSISGVAYATATTATLDLAFDGTDFDSDYTTFNVTISSIELFGLDDLLSNNLTITATADAEVLSMSDDGTIDEGSENSEVITINISGGTFVDPINEVDFLLANLPEGVDVGSISRTNANNVEITLSGNRTADYDLDIENLNVSIQSSAFDEYDGDAVVVSSGVVFIAIVESATITHAGLDESNLDLADITLTLTNDSFFDATLEAGSFSLSDQPLGLTVSSVTYNSATNATITLGFDGSDFDIDYSDFNIVINANELVGAGDIRTDSLSITAIIESQTATIAHVGGGLTEENLNTAEVSITISGDSFVDATLDMSNFDLLGEPVGLTIESISYTSSTEASMILAYDGTDIDSDYTNLKLSIAASELNLASSITSNNISITATDDSETIAISDDGLIDEGMEDGEIITVDLTGGTFVNSLNVEYWNFANLPEGVTIGSVTRIDSITAEITLAGNREQDYDSNISNASLEIQEYEVDDHTGSSLIVNTGILFTAVDDDESIVMSDDGEILEGSESSEVISVVLSGGTFVNGLNIANWSMTNLPTGVSLGSLYLVDSANVQITLFGNATADYDTDINDAVLSISEVEVNDYSGADLSASTGVTFTAIVEVLNKVVEIFHPGLTEENLNGADITISLTDETFVDATLDESNFILNNAPSGTSVNFVTYNSATSATLKLVFDGDFDADISDFNISILADELADNEDLTSNDLSITAIVESETATIAHVGAGLTEENLNSEVVTFDLTNEDFVNSSLNAQNFVLNNAPEGLYIADVIYVDINSAEILLAFDYVDFDASITDFNITVLEIELVGSANISSNSITITATDDAEILTMSDDGSLIERSEDTEIVTVNLTGGTFVNPLDENNWVMYNLPNGISLDSVEYFNETSALLTLTGNSLVDYDTDITNTLVKIYKDDVNDYEGDSIEISTGVTFTALNENLTISHIGLTEENIDGAVVNATLTDDEFVDATLELTNFILSGAPLGVSIASVEYVDPQNVNVNLAYDETDFDTDSTNLMLSIESAELLSGYALESNALTISATVEEQTAKISHAGLTEENLNEALIEVELTEVAFIDNSIENQNVSLMNAPLGLTVDTIYYISPASANIALIFDGTDFDSNYDDFRITFDVAELIKGSNITSNALEIVATNDEESIEIASTAIVEGQENGAVLDVELDGGTFAVTFDEFNWSVNNLPQGVSVDTIIRIDSVTAEIQLKGNTNEDYDADIENVYVEVDEEEVFDFEDGSLVSNNISFNANDEMLSITHAGLTEENLDNASIQLALSDDEFADNSFALSNFILNNEPDGVSISSVEYVDATTANIVLEFDGTDFDIDITDFNITVSKNEIISLADLTSNNLTITAISEGGELTIANSNLSEDILNQAEIIITLELANFVDNLFVNSNFVLNEIPAGLTVDTVYYTSATEAMLILHFDGTDFDSDYAEFSLTIQASELSNGESLTSNLLEIIAIDDTEVLSFASDGDVIEGYEDAEIIQVEIEGGTFKSELHNANWSFSNLPQGVSIESITLVNNKNADILLTGNRTIDYDQNIDIELIVNADQIDDLETGSLNALGNVIFTAFNEQAVAYHPGLNEENLNGAVIQIALIDEHFVDDQIDVSNINLFFAPLNTVVEEVSYVNDTAVNVLLSYDGTDMTEDVDNFSLSIAATELFGVTDLNTNDLFIDADPNSIAEISEIIPRIYAQNEFVYIQFEDVNESYINGEVRIYDTQGKLLLTKKLEPKLVNQIQVPAVTQDYIIRVISNNKMHTKKLYIDNL